MILQKDIIDAFVQLAATFSKENEKLQAAITRTYVENNWLTQDNYNLALSNWKEQLTPTNLSQFCEAYHYSNHPKSVGIIMAGNIPMVGFHDVLCVLLSGNKAVIKTSSDDKYVIPYLLKELIVVEPKLQSRIDFVERVQNTDAVIATGSNNTFRYFQHYFQHIPHLLRKNRKSMAILNGNESDRELDLLADDVFLYFGLGCRNVSLLALPASMNITRVLDHLMRYKELENHNKFANNYTYHRAILLMNSEQHLDTGFVLAKERKELNAPLSCINYFTYSNEEELDLFIKNNEENIQCIVGKYSHVNSVDYGQSQNPNIQDFADDVDTMKFLNSLHETTINTK